MSKLEKQWTCLEFDCDYKVIQDDEPGSCPSCVERHGEDDSANQFEYSYKCPYCDIFMIPLDPDDGWINCESCGFQFETEFHDEIIKNVHKHLDAYNERVELADKGKDRARYRALLAHPEWVIMQQGERELWGVRGLTQWHPTVDEAIDKAMEATDETE